MIEKDALTADEIKHLEKILTVKPALPRAYAGTVSSFPIFLKSAHDTISLRLGRSHITDPL